MDQNQQHWNCRQGFSRLSNLMPAVIAHVKQAGPTKGINVDSIAGRVTMNAISLAIFGKTMGCCDELAQESRPRLAQLTADGEWLPAYFFFLCTCRLAEPKAALHQQPNRQLQMLLNLGLPDSKTGDQSDKFVETWRLQGRKTQAFRERFLSPLLLKPGDG